MGHAPRLVIGVMGKTHCVTRGFVHTILDNMFEPETTVLRLVVVPETDSVAQYIYDWRRIAHESVALHVARTRAGEPTAAWVEILIQRRPRLDILLAFDGSNHGLVGIARKHGVQVLQVAEFSS